MRMKQAKPVLAARLAGVVALGLGMAVSAAGKDREPTGHSPPGQDDDAVQIIIRSDAEKKQRQRQDSGNRNHDNSNRQSDQDSERGLERAEERRSEQADEHAQAGNKEDDGWYEYLFGKRQNTDKQSEGAWYDYLFGKGKKSEDKPDKKDDGDSSWWWPFD